jgi:plastocyanin
MPVSGHTLMTCGAMGEGSEPGCSARRSLLRRVFGAGVMVLISSRARLAAAEAQVVIDNFTFAPTPLVVKVGSSVTWVNHDDIPHSIVCAVLKMKSHPLDIDESFAFKFRQAGTYDYSCGLHPHMHGRVTVRA